MTPPPAGSSYEVVTFDFWDTLVCAPAWEASQERRAERVSVVMRRYGIEPDPEHLGRAVRAVAETFDHRWAANEHFGAHEAVEVLLAELLIDVDEEHRVELVEAFATTRNPALAPLTPNIGETLAELRGRGLRLGIICDVGLQPSPVLRGHLRAHGLLDLFDHWSFSDEVGCYKPHPEIFRHALEGLELDDPSRAAHVGDLRTTDVAGAVAAGMTAVRYAGRKDDPPKPGVPEAHHVISDHCELLETLGLL